MPRSKHRRKPGGKAVAHPGRGKSGRPLAWLEELEESARTVGLPLFDWADRAEDPAAEGPSREFTHYRDDTP